MNFNAIDDCVDVIVVKTSFSSNYKYSSNDNNERFQENLELNLSKEFNG